MRFFRGTATAARSFLVFCLLATSASAQRYEVRRENFLSRVAALPRPGGAVPQAAASEFAVLRRADAARSAGLAAVDAGQFASAAYSFDHARWGRPCSPDVIFNLALAHERAGNPVPAALWLRAWLTMLPDAPNAAAVRAEIGRLAAEVEARSQRLFDEAERLARTLSDQPVSSGTPSLREAALGNILNYADFAGADERAERVAAEIARLAPGRPVARNGRRERGLFVIEWTRDSAGMERALAAVGPDLTPRVRASYLANVALARFDRNRVERLFQTFPRAAIRDIRDRWHVYNDLSRQGYHDIQARLLSADVAENPGPVFGEALFAHIVQAAVDAHFGGRPDIAREMARLGRAYIEQRDSYLSNEVYDRAQSRSNHYDGYMVLLALLGDRPAIERLAAGWNDWAPLHVNDLARAELVALTTMADADAAAVIRAINSAEGRYYWDSDVVSLERSKPVVEFATAVARNDEAAALRALDRVPDPVGPEQNMTNPMTDWDMALNFAVATDRVELANAIARKMPAGGFGLTYQMSRLSNRSGRQAERQVSASLVAASCEGWRPRDDAHALAVYWRIYRALDVGQYNGEYSGVPDNLDAMRRENPEQVPTVLAQLALVLAGHAAGARFEEAGL